MKAMSEAEVRRLNIPIIEDPSLGVPGLSIQNPGPGRSVIAIRGVSSGQIGRDQLTTAGQSGCERLGAQCGRGPQVGRRCWLPFSLRDATEIEQLTHELRLVSDEGGDVRWLVSAFFSSAERDHSRRLPIPGQNSLHESSGELSPHPWHKGAPAVKLSATPVAAMALARTALRASARSCIGHASQSNASGVDVEVRDRCCETMSVNICLVFQETIREERKHERRQRQRCG
ncbi:MAG: hypothetical protein OXU19_01665 [bacterium]|nr:hypothetical protein [bacterium]MDE0241264.1 hypothetical protein [bacterium]MDE0416453.1 hypothetical protein [bacterium]